VLLICVAAEYISEHGVDKMPCSMREPCRTLKFVMQQHGSRKDPLTIFCTGNFVEDGTDSLVTRSFSLLALDGASCSFSPSQAGDVSFLNLSAGTVFLRGIFVSGYSKRNGSGAIVSRQQSLNITNCTFHDNGGSAVFASGSVVNISNSVFADNMAGSHMSRNAGGALFFGSSTALLTGCTFSNNKAADAGGAVACSASSCKVYGSSFASNAAPWGSAIYNCKPLFEFCFLLFF